MGHDPTVQGRRSHGPESLKGLGPSMLWLLHQDTSETDATQQDTAETAAQDTAETAAHTDPQQDTAEQVGHYE